MKKAKLLFCLILSLLIFGCGSEQISKSEIDYSDLKTVKSKYSDLQFQIPNNFTLIKENSPSYFDICLVDRNYTSAVYLVPFIFSEENKAEDINDLENLVDYSVVLKESEFEISIDKNNIKFFNIGNLDFASYQFIDNNKNYTDVVIFNHISGPQEFTFKTINQKISGNPVKFDQNVQKIILSSVR